MEERHFFRVKSIWSGGGNGDGEITADNRAYPYGKPEGLGGQPGRTSPEELLVAAVASCYSVTLGVIAERKGVALRAVELTAEGEVSRHNSQPLRVTAVRLWPRLVLEEGSGEEERRRAEEVARTADRYCLISNALRGNVEVTVTPEAVVAREPAARLA